MKIDSIVNGIVIDHITAGKAMQLYNLLHLQSVNASVAILMNAVSRKWGERTSSISTPRSPWTWT